MAKDQLYGPKGIYNKEKENKKQKKVGSKTTIIKDTF